MTVAKACPVNNKRTTAKEPTTVPATNRVLVLWDFRGVWELSVGDKIELVVVDEVFEIY